MVTVRRWYVFLVCAISLNAVAWAVIALLRNLLAFNAISEVTITAFQIAVIVVGLPVFLVHWLWAQRLAGKDLDERQSGLRRLYLYGVLAGCLGPAIANAVGLLTSLLCLIFGQPCPMFDFSLSPAQALRYDLTALIVLGGLWFYHQRLAAHDAQTAPETGASATVRRLYLFGFNAAGGTLTTLAVIHLLRWVMFQFGNSGAVISGNAENLLLEVARLAVGLAVGLAFWTWAQRLFAGPNAEERESALRKFYLYVTVFIAVLTVVGNATLLLAGFFRQLLGLPSLGDWRIPLPIILSLLSVWAYQAYILRGDAAVASEAPQQAGVRRLYLYLVAAVGLAAFLVGLSGLLSVLIRSLSGAFFGDALKEQVAWFAAALLAGLPVWLLPWRSVQLGAAALTPLGIEERRSIVRKIHLYFYLFVATMTVLSSLVYIVYRLLSLVLGEHSEVNLLADIGQAIAFTAIAAGVLAYHGLELRNDGQLNRREQGQRLSGKRVVIVDVAAAPFGRAVLETLRRELPDLPAQLIELNPPPPEAGDAVEIFAAQLAGAGLIVGPWHIVTGFGNPPLAPLAQAIAASPARKVLCPAQLAGWEWAGVDQWSAEALTHQTVRAVKQWAEGEELKAARPLSAGAIIGIIVGIIIGVMILLNVISAVVSSFGG